MMRARLVAMVVYSCAAALLVAAAPLAASTDYLIAMPFADMGKDFVQKFDAKSLAIEAWNPWPQSSFSVSPVTTTPGARLQDMAFTAITGGSTVKEPCFLTRYSVTNLTVLSNVSFTCDFQNPVLIDAPSATVLGLEEKENVGWQLLEANGLTGEVAPVGPKLPARTDGLVDLPSGTACYSHEYGRYFAPWYVANATARYSVQSGIAVFYYGEPRAPEVHLLRKGAFLNGVSWAPRSARFPDGAIIGICWPPNDVLTRLCAVHPLTFAITVLSPAVPLYHEAASTLINDERGVAYALSIYGVVRSYNYGAGRGEAWILRGQFPNRTLTDMPNVAIATY